MHTLEIHIQDCVVHPRPQGREHKFLHATLEVATESPYLVEMTVRDADDLVFRAEIPVEALGDLMLAAEAMVRRSDAAT